MITLENTKRVLELLEKGAIPLAIGIDIARYSNGDLLDKEFNSITIGDVVKTFTLFDSSFMDYYGGDFHVCENEEDLKEIKGINFEWAAEHDDKWPSCDELAMSWDIAGYIDNRPETGWAILSNCTNDAGGHLYYIPSFLWEKAFIKEHIRLTHNFWSKHEDN